MKTLVTERDVLDAWQNRKRRLLLSPNAVVTPAAQEAAKSHQIELVRQTAAPEPKAVRAGEKPTSRLVVMGADHGGFELKEVLKEHVSALGFEVEDVGTYSPESVDYPDFAHAVAQRVARNSGSRGIIIDGAGVGSAMVANKVPGIRAATCHDVYTARNSRQHNNANVLTLGSRVLGIDVAKQVVAAWLAAEFEGGRHARRVDKIIAIDHKYRAQ